MEPRQDERDVLLELSSLIRERNRVEASIARLIGRPAHPGHVGEFIASRIFGIVLEPSATAKGIDGRFPVGGPLGGCSVNVKWYPRNAGLLDINPDGVPDYYLVLAGQWTPPVSSRGFAAPWLITHIFLFDAADLVAKLRRRGVKIGTATSVARAYWDEAEVYPRETNTALPLTEDQRELLRLFEAPVASPEN